MLQAILSSSSPTHVYNQKVTMADWVEERRNKNPNITATVTSSTNFQLIFNYALDVYKKRTKNDLLAHILAAELQKCNSPSAILAVLH